MSEKRKIEKEEKAETRKKYESEEPTEAYTESAIFNDFLRGQHSLGILPVCYATKNWKAFRNEIQQLIKNRASLFYFNVHCYWAIAAQDSNLEVLEILKEFKVPFDGCYYSDEVNPLSLFGDDRFDFPNDQVRDWFKKNF